jgi:hypothetical protein
VQKLRLLSVILVEIVIISACNKNDDIASSLNADKSIDNGYEQSNKCPLNTATHWETAQVISYKNGGKLTVDKGLYFQVMPFSMSLQADTRILAEVDFVPTGDSYRLTFHFEPSALAFDPPALVELKWDNLGLPPLETPSLFLWDVASSCWIKISDYNDTSGFYRWDKNGKKVSFFVHHFSLYSFSKD